MKTRASVGAAGLLLLLYVALLAVAAGPARAEEDARAYVKVAESEDAAPSDERFFDDPESAWDFAASQQGGNAYMRLGADWRTSRQHTMGADLHPHVFIDLQGHNIVRDTGGGQVSDGGLFLVERGAELVISDSDPRSNGYKGVRGGVITGGASTNGGGAFTVEDGGRLEIRGGTVYRCTSNEHGGAVLIRGSKASFEMTGGRIYFCQTTRAFGECHGGAVYSEQATLRFKNCTIDSCYSEDSGGALYMYKGNARFERAMLLGNHCLDYGGAVYVGQGELYMDGCRVSGSEAKDDGGAIYDDSTHGIKLSGCVFYRNKSYGDGGALYVNDRAALLINTDIVANSASGYGGGVYVDSRYDVALKGLMRIRNNSGKDGRDNLTLQDGNVSRAYLMNGGLYEGSEVGLSSTSRNVVYASDVSETQMGYFFSDTGGLALGEEYPRASLFVSTTLGEMTGAGIALSLAMAAIAGTAVYLALSRRGGASTSGGTTTTGSTRS